MEYSQQEQKEILEIANLICDFNTHKGGVGERYLPYAAVRLKQPMPLRSMMQDTVRLLPARNRLCDKVCQCGRRGCMPSPSISYWRNNK